MARDPYQELGVSRTASADEVRKAFRKLAKQHHPDTNHDKGSEEKFKRVTAAFDIVGDPDKRKKFDAGAIDADGRETMRGYGGPGRGPGGARPEGFENVDISDLFSDILGRGQGRGGGGGFGGFQARGGDVRAKLEIDLEDAIQGGRQRIAFSDGRTLDVTIPKGAIDGQMLRLKGQGSPGRSSAGDAIIELVIRPHPVFRREGDDLVMDVPISVPDAVLGGKVEVPTPEGPVTLTVPKGSNSGSRLRLKGRGAPLTQGGGKRGDLFARLIVTLPDTPDAELEKLAQAWRADRPYSPRRRA